MDLVALYLAHGLGGLYLAHGLAIGGPLPSIWTWRPFT